MSFYHSDLIDIQHNTINPETGVKVKGVLEENVPCRVEMYNNMIMSNTGREELAQYLIMLDNKLNLLDDITVKSVMGTPIDRKSYPIKKFFPVGDYSLAQYEVYL